MLKTRIITALVLLAVLLPALFAPQSLPFALLTLLMIGAAGWEWARLNGVAGAAALAFGSAVAVGGWSIYLALGMQAPPAWCWWLASLVWVLGSAYALRGGPSQWPHASKLLRMLLGALVLVAAWLAMVQAKTVGINFLLSIFCLVWMADIAAYFGGRAFGKRKLAPTISPGKSWEGVWSGMAGVLLLGFVWVHGIDSHLSVDSLSLFSQLVHRFGPASLLCIGLLCAMSVVGDLFESLIKRAVGAKDSSQLLPGHGGVLDRVDALLPVFPLAIALSTL
jgi:phosphatidate cytidylyltransferase